MIITAKQLIENPNIPVELIKNGGDHGQLTLELFDGNVTGGARNFILNMLMHYPLYKAKLNILKSDIFDMSTLKAGVISEVNTHIYTRLLDCTELTKRARLELIWESINRLYATVCKHMGKYHQTIDGLGLAKLVSDPKVKKICDTRVENTEGSMMAEKKFAMAGSKLLTLMNTPGELKHNQLINLSKSGHIKPNSLSQIFVAYGTRSDVDGRIMKHIVNESALSGLKSVADYAVETLAAKKAQKESKTTIQQSQSLGRYLRIVTSTVAIVHRGWCGNTLTIPHRIERDYKDNYLYNTVIDNGKRVYLLQNNIDEYVDKVVNLVSPMTCRHSDGFCEYCAGWANGRAYDFLTDDVVGVSKSTVVIRQLSQDILSTKHRDSTRSGELVLSKEATAYFYVSSGNIHLKPEFVKSKHMMIRIPLTSLRPLTDLQENYADVVDSFSWIDQIAIVDRNLRVISELSLATENELPYLSIEVLEMLRDGEIRADVDYIYIPFNELPRDVPVMNTIILTTDMREFVDTLKGLMQCKTRGFSKHTSLSRALQEFTSTIFSKTQINIFHLQVIMRAFLLDPAGGSQIPVVTDINNVKLGTIDEVATTRSVSMKLAAGSLKTWLNATESFTIVRGKSMQDPLFGLGF